MVWEAGIQKSNFLSGSRCWDSNDGAKARHFLLNGGLELPFQSNPPASSIVWRRWEPGVGCSYISTVPALQTSQPASDSRSRLLNAPEHGSGHHSPSSSPKVLQFFPFVLPTCPPFQPTAGWLRDAPSYRQGTRLLAASPSAPEVAATKMWYDPSKLIRGANSKFAGTAVASARPSARSPRRVRSPLSLPQTPAPGNLRGGTKPQVLPGPGGSCRTSTPAGSLAPPTATAARPSHPHSPARAGAAILALAPRTPPPTHPGAAAAAAAAATRSGGYVTCDAAAGPAPRARSAAVETGSVSARQRRAG